MDRRLETRDITTAALLAALLAASALLAIPVGPVPVTLQSFMVMLIALLLRPARAALAIGVYLLVGAVGFPVFAGMQGGLGVLLGPTGGYLWGFLAGGVAGSAVRVALEHRATRQIICDVAAVSVVVVIVYALGATQLALVSGLTPEKALLAGVAPFIALDVAKAAAAVVVAAALRRSGAARTERPTPARPAASQ